MFVRFCGYFFGGTNDDGRDIGMWIFKPQKWGCDPEIVVKWKKGQSFFLHSGPQMVMFDCRRLMPFETLIDFGHLEDLKLVPFLMGPTFVTQYWALGMLELSFSILVCAGCPNMAQWLLWSIPTNFPIFLIASLTNHTCWGTSSLGAAQFASDCYSSMSAPQFATDCYSSLHPPRLATECYSSMSAPQFATDCNCLGPAPEGGSKEDHPVAGAKWTESKAGCRLVATNGWVFGNETFWSQRFRHSNVEISSLRTGEQHQLKAENSFAHEIKQHSFRVTYCHIHFVRG